MRRGRKGEAKKHMISWLRGYEERKGQINSNSNFNYNYNYNSSNYSNYKEPKQPREPSQTFVSNKYDFQGGLMVDFIASEMQKEGLDLNNEENLDSYLNTKIM